ncbi:MAG TPA: DnaJ domain-containing protein [Ktedonobacteraceae bacterium]|nr:DnaJ domain-containing protein [Ktedonobacteraceae bacterium]
MKSFTDYYAVLEVDARASNPEIRAAFKKLALKFHPDVYKGADAEDKMRHILEAYQTLNDPQKRRAYDMIRSEHLPDARSYSPPVATSTPIRPMGSKPDQGNVVSPKARRDRQRHYAFPDLKPDRPADFSLGKFSYSLTSEQVARLVKNGLLRGKAPTSRTGEQGLYHCHRCQHEWQAVTLEGLEIDRTCPHCHSDDWSEFLLLRCVHCSAVFESEQIRYEIGTYDYGDGALCPPYELFPLCPYCGTANWSPAENLRVDTLRAKVAVRNILFFWLRLVLVALILLGAFLALVSVMH